MDWTLREKSSSTDPYWKCRAAKCHAPKCHAANPEKIFLIELFLNFYFPPHTKISISPSFPGPGRVVNCFSKFELSIRSKNYYPRLEEIEPVANNVKNGPFAVSFSYSSRLF